MNKFRLMKKNDLFSIQVWLFLGCAALAFCVLGWYIVCTDFIPLPPSPQLFDWIGLVILPIIIIVLLMTCLRRNNNIGFLVQACFLN